MFLSKLILDPRDRQVQMDLASPYEMHRTLWSRFPSLRKGGSGENLDRILFRVDWPVATGPDGGNPFVLVQSVIEPDWTGLPAGYHADAVKWLEPSLEVGQSLRFRLRANPTRKVGTASKSERLAGVKNHGKRVAIFHDKELISWLLDKGATKDVKGKMQGGFTIPVQWQAQQGVNLLNFRVNVLPEGWVRCGKAGHEGGDFFAVRFDGILQVTDPAAFRNTLSAGIGSAKGFGFGLLSIASAEVLPGNLWEDRRTDELLHEHSSHVWG